MLISLLSFEPDIDDARFLASAMLASSKADSKINAFLR